MLVWSQTVCHPKEPNSNLKILIKNLLGFLLFLFVLKNAKLHKKCHNKSPKCLSVISAWWLFGDATTLSITTLSIMTLSIKDLYLTLSTSDTQHNNALPLYTECRVLLIIMVNVTMLSVIMLNVIMLSVVAPYLDGEQPL